MEWLRDNGAEGEGDWRAVLTAATEARESIAALATGEGGIAPRNASTAPKTGDLRLGYDTGAKSFVIQVFGKGKSGFAWKNKHWFPRLGMAALHLFEKTLLAGEPGETIEELIAAVDRAAQVVAAAVRDAV